MGKGMGETFVSILLQENAEKTANEQLNKMNKQQLDILSEAVNFGLSLQYILDSDLSLEQMSIILEGLKFEKENYLKPGKIVCHYTFSKMPVEQMSEILEDAKKKLTPEHIIESQRRSLYVYFTQSR